MATPGVFKRELEFHKAESFEEAESWEIQQQTRMTPEERQQVARELRRRVYGDSPPDVRESENAK